MLFYVLWVVSTALGTVLGGVLDDPNALGLDAAFAALFLALAMPYLRNRRGASRRRRSRPAITLVAHAVRSRRGADHRRVRRRASLGLRR